MRTNIGINNWSIDDDEQWGMALVGQTLDAREPFPADVDEFRTLAARCSLSSSDLERVFAGVQTHLRNRIRAAHAIASRLHEIESLVCTETERERELAWLKEQHKEWGLEAVPLCGVAADTKDTSAR